MKRLAKHISLILCLSFLFSSISFAADSSDIINEFIDTTIQNETLDSIVMHEDNIENVIASTENTYDMTTYMPEEAIKELSSIANISKEEQWLDETHLQVSYNLIPKNPIIEKKFKSGNTEEIYSITNYTYVMNLSENSGNTTDTSVQSDVTLKNTVYYSYYDNASVRMLKVSYGTSTVTRFLESGLRNLELNVLSQGTSNNGFSDESNSRVIPTPYVNSNYSLQSNFNNHYHTGAAKILYGCAVTYSHGNSSYTARAQINLGS